MRLWQGGGYTRVKEDAALRLRPRVAQSGRLEAAPRCGHSGGSVTVALRHRRSRFTISFYATHEAARKERVYGLLEPPSRKAANF